MSRIAISMAEVGPSIQILPPQSEVARFETPTMQHLQALATTAAIEGLTHDTAVTSADEVLVPTMKEEPKKEDLPQRKPAEDGGAIEETIERNKGGDDKK